MRSALLALLFAAGLPRAHAELQVTDDAGRTVRLPRPAQRVLSLAPSATELVYEAGGGARLVGTVEHTDYPPAARALPRVGGNQKLDLERIASLKPDLVLVWLHGTPGREIEQLATLGFPLFHLESRKIEDVPDALERLGRLLGAGDTAKRAAEGFRARHRSLRARFPGRAPLAVFYQVSGSPLLTINDRQLISDVLRSCGGRNVFGKEPALVPQVSTESVVAARPDVILAADPRPGNADGVRARREPAHPAFATWRRFGSMKAVRKGQLWLVPANPISRQGPRILDAVEAVCTALEEARRAE